MRVLIIAEAGVNHNGSLALAKVLVEKAAKAGADFVKFQTFKADQNISPKASKAKYQTENTGESESQLEMVTKLELSREDHIELKRHAEKHNIGFLSTAFDYESVDLLKELDIPYFKVPSGEITNLPFLEKVASTRKPVIISTGMATLDEVKQVTAVFLSQGYSKEEITVLHCNTQYPTPMGDVNLRAMQTIADYIGVKVGYSDHTLGIEVPIAAVAIGAQVIEKHFTLSRDLPGPDHKASLEPDELKQMVLSIRNVEIALGNREKKVSSSELGNRDIARKSIHLKTALNKDHELTMEDLIMLRPGDGISPMDYKQIIGKKISRDLDRFHQLKWSDFHD